MLSTAAVRSVKALDLREQLDEAESRRWTDIISLTINLEHAGDIIERTAIAANAAVGRSRLEALTARLSGVSLAGYALNGGRQSLSGDTLRVRRDATSALEAASVVRYEAAA